MKYVIEKVRFYIRFCVEEGQAEEHFRITCTHICDTNPSPKLNNISKNRKKKQEISQYLFDLKQENIIEPFFHSTAYLNLKKKEKKLRSIKLI